MYKKVISIEAQLKKIVEDAPEYGELWSTWNLNKKTLEPILNAIIKDYPHYSFHDHSHSESILLNIEKVLGTENIEKLSPTDLWLLLHVAYLHDFGMVILDTKIHEFWGSSDFRHYLEEQRDSDNEEFRKAANTILSSNKDMEEFNILWPLDVKEAVTLLTSKYCRWQHGDFSRNYILDIKNVWGIDIGHNGVIKKRLVSLVADISAMHTKSFDDVFTLHKEANGFKGDYVHPRLVACLLRLGDVLDLDNGRFNYYGEKIFGKMPNDSKIHYGKHEATKHVLISDKLIEVEADCPTDDIYRETRKWYDSLKREIEKMHLNWSDIATDEFDYPPKLAPYKILRDGVEDKNELYDLRFTISRNKAFEILEGSSIYKDKFSCIREIVQNAEDASKIQLWRDIKSGMYYNDEEGISKSKVQDGTLLPSDIPRWIYQVYAIHINVERDENNNAIVSVVDHGTGITLDSLKDLCNVGKSYFQKKEKEQEVEEMPVWLRPTASFGIGLQSCFMITDKITIYTNSSKDGSYKMTFKSGKGEGYVNVESSKDFSIRGSKVILEIENDLNFSFDLLGFTAKNLTKIDQFESNCIIIYKIIESIFKECDSSFFEIKVISKSINFADSILTSMLIKEEFLSERGGEYFYSLSEDKSEMRCWYNNNLYKIILNKKYGGIIRIKFKGKAIRSPHINSIRYIGFNVEVDIYGLATKDALSLNREVLSTEAANKICKDIDVIIRWYFELLSKDIESIRGNQELLDSYMLTSWLYETTFPKTLKECVSTEENIHVVRYDESDNKYKLDCRSLREIANDFPQIPYIKQRIQNSRLLGEDVLIETDLIEMLNESSHNKKLYPLLIIDNDLKKFLSRKEYDISYLDCKENISICMVELNDKLYTPDIYTKKQLIKNLVYRDSIITFGKSMSIIRKAIPAFKEYSKIAVTLKNLPFIGSDEKSKWKIISPITKGDFEEIRKFTKDAFIEYIVGKPTFNNLVAYVFEHGQMKNEKGDIIDEYKRLIGEFYDGEFQAEKIES